MDVYINIIINVLNLLINSSMLILMTLTYLHQPDEVR